MKKVFLGGTCAESTWREKLIPMLTLDHFDPVVEDWNEEAQANELREREECDFCLYVITPDMQGVYSIAEVIDDSNKRPEKTVFCVIEDSMFNDFNRKLAHSLKAVGDMVERNGSKFFGSLQDVASYLNKA